MRHAEDGGATKRTAGDDLRKSKVPTLFPVPIGGEKNQFAKATLAPPQSVQRLQPLQASPKLTADRLRRLQHAVIRFADNGIRESEHPHDDVFRRDRKYKCTLLSGFGSQSRRGQARSAGPVEYP